MVSIYSLPSHTLHIRCPIPVVQRTANQITSPYPSKKGKKVSITPISSTKNNTILGNSCARSNRLERSNRSSKTNGRTNCRSDRSVWQEYRGEPSGCVSRLMLWRYPNRTALEPGVRLLPEVLKKTGYQTCHIGKWHVTENPLLPYHPPRITQY